MLSFYIWNVTEGNKKEEKKASQPFTEYKDKKMTLNTTTGYELCHLIWSYHFAPLLSAGCFQNQLRIHTLSVKPHNKHALLSNTVCGIYIIN